MIHEGLLPKITFLTLYDLLVKICINKIQLQEYECKCGIRTIFWTHEEIRSKDSNSRQIWQIFGVDKSGN
jgi:hypothetical protein